MKLTGLLALNLALLRAIPIELLGAPIFVYLIAALNLALVLLLIYRRPPGVRHTLFLASGFLLFIAHALYVNHLVRVGPLPDPAWPRILERAVLAYESFTGDFRPVAWTRRPGFRTAEGFFTSLIGLGLAWLIGLGFEWLLRVRRVDFNGRGWRGTVGASRGVLFGLILSAVVLIGLEVAFSSMRIPSSGGTLVRLAVLLSFLLIGGVLGWVLGRRIRDDEPRPG
jgi:hypothetical protein